MRLPHLETTEDVDVAVVGIPTDDAVSYRSGARFGPEAIRSASVFLRPFNPYLRVEIFDHLSVVDYGDAPTLPGYHEQTLQRIKEYLEPIHRAGVVPLCLGGDHSIVLARASAPMRPTAPIRSRRRSTTSRPDGSARLRPVDAGEPGRSA